MDPSNKTIGHPIYNLRDIIKNEVGKPLAKTPLKIGTENQALIPKRDMRKANLFSVKYFVKIFAI